MPEQFLLCSISNQTVHGAYTVVDVNQNLRCVYLNINSMLQFTVL